MQPSQERLLDSVVWVIRESSSEHPADSKLRERLKTSWMGADGKREVARMVFRYYRWLGWLPRESSLELQIEAASKMNVDLVSTEDLFKLAVPGWVSDHVDVSEGWLRSLQVDPVLWIRAKASGAEALRNVLPGLSKAHPEVPQAYAYTGTEDLFRSDSFTAGQFEIQDLSSQRVSMACAPKPGETWWDACAGEGGKMLHLADLMQGKGLIWASDVAEWRLEKLKKRAKRAGVFNYRLSPWTKSGRPPIKTKFDGILVDAPCSGAGTWQRNPQARWTLSSTDVTRLAQEQGKILNSVVSNLKPGGRLIYAVCTLTKDETTAVSDCFAAQHPELEELERRWLWPHLQGGNGMYYAIWRLKS